MVDLDFSFIIGNIHILITPRLHRGNLETHILDIEARAR